MLEPRKPQFPLQDERAILAGVLETFPYAEAGQPLDIVIETDEFTALCPWTGLPDFGTVTVTYVPDQRCLELRAFKYYLLSYRSVGIVQEHATRRILNDLVRACAPIRMTVKMDYRIRGGVHTVCTAEYRKSSDE